MTIDSALSRLGSNRRVVLIGTAVLLAGAFFAVALMPGGTRPRGQDDAAATAATEDGGVEKPAPPRGPGLDAASRVGGALVVVIGLLIVAALVAARLLRRTRLAPGGERTLRLLDAIPLGPKRQVWVVGAYGRRLIIGTTGDSIQLLTELGEDEIVAEPGSEPDFRTRLEQRIETPTPARWEVEA